MIHLILRQPLPSSVCVAITGIPFTPSYAAKDSVQMMRVTLYRGFWPICSNVVISQVPTLSEAASGRFCERHVRTFWRITVSTTGH